MIDLRAPEQFRYQAWREAVDEFGDESIHGAGPPAAALDHAAFTALVTALAREADTAISPEPGRVHCTYFWISEGARLLGFLALRHSLNDYLLEQGGHIGFSVRPSARRRGVATAGLSAALPVAAGLGIESVLVCCDEDNLGSRRVIEGCGGVHEDSRAGVRRYWVRTN